MPKKRRDGSISFPDMVAFGENPGGLISQTANETARDTSGPGRQEFKWAMEADSARWNTWPYEEQEKKQRYNPPRRGK